MRARALSPRLGRGGRRWVAAAVVLLAVTIQSISAQAGPIGTASGFEDDDGNLAPAAGGFDWNSFSPVTWTGSAPYQQANKVVNGWAFTGLTDQAKKNTDTGFAGGTKQDNSCASVIGSSAPNKDDLERAYVSSKTAANGHVYLNLAWMRINQNSTSSSTHVGFEFNQADTPCGAASDGLVQRSAGDLLIVYDFEGGTANPTLTARRWVLSGSCEVGSVSAPCWGTATNLTASGFAEAKVNIASVGPVTDTVAPGGDTLGLVEFGEAGIDLTNTGIFDPNGSCISFGRVEAVSRSSGNSGTASMEDLVGPGLLDIDNCRDATITSAQKITLSDFAKPTGFPVGGNLTGTVTFQLFDNASCLSSPTPPNHKLYDSGPVTLVNGLASTPNPPLVNTNGTYYWLVSYSGDANNLASTSACGAEQTTITGNAPGIVP